MSWEHSTAAATSIAQAQAAGALTAGAAAAEGWEAWGAGSAAGAEAEVWACKHPQGRVFKAMP